MKQTIYDFLKRSPVAASPTRLDLGAGCNVAIWQNHHDRVSYDSPQDHTFSLYLAGGTGTRRLDAGNISGLSGALSIMPEGCGSEWEISAPFQFVHLYLSDRRLRSEFSRIHDCDARRLELPEVTFVDNPRLSGPLRSIAAAAQSADLLRAETALAELYGALTDKSVPILGGLAPYLLRRVDEWIAAHIDEVIHLHDLASLCDLSDFHFHRMFRLSRGAAPHDWVTRCRIAYARQLLNTDQPLADIALACGFSSQSHLTRIFRHQTGRTPGDYRKMLSA